MSVNDSRKNAPHSAHYKHGLVEPIDLIRSQELNFEEGSIVKYVTRSRHTGKRMSDLEKARWYLDALIEQERERQDDE